MNAVIFRVFGRVQGVGFRFFATNLAHRHGLTGWVRNVPDGSVEILVQGQDQAIGEFETKLLKGPPGSQIDSFQKTRQSPDPRLAAFEIIR